MHAGTDLLQLIRFRVSIFHNAKICGNWRIEEHSPGHTCFHLVTVGQCRLHVPGRAETVLSAGDLLLFPREIAHSMTPGESLQGAQAHLPYSEATTIPGTGLLCAEVSFRHSAASRMLDALPEVFIVRNQDAAWLSPLRDMILQESTGGGTIAEAVLERLCELLFVYALAYYLNDVPEKRGLLALYAHPRLSKALNAIHENPDRAWTLEELAGTAAMSRTAFANAFRDISGWTAVQYLTWWRMQLASDLLAAGESVASTALQVGFQSQSAFSRAYKRCFGISAGAVKRMPPGRVQ